MSNKIIDFCKKCKKDVSKRFVKSGKNGYYTCTVCSENNSKKHRDRYRFRYLAQKANSRNRPNSEKITEEMLLELYKRQNKCCALSGIPFDMSRSYYKPSLDRIDNAKGYMRDNIQIVLYIVNMMKRELDEQDFRSMCYNISDHFSNQLRMQGNHLFIQE